MIFNTTLNTEIRNWIRALAEETLPICAYPPIETVQQLIAIYLPEKIAELSLKFDNQELFETLLGILVIVEYGREKIGWAATTDPLEAEKMRQLYSNAPYRQIRDALGIGGYWIFLGDRQFLYDYHSEDVYEKAPDPIEAYEQFPEFSHLKKWQEPVIVKL
jgi:hypothetical protein